MELSENNDLLYTIALSNIDGIGSVFFKNLVMHFGSAQAVFETPKGKLLKIQGVGESIIKGLSRKTESLEEAERIIELSHKKNIKILPLTSPDYPKTLKAVFDCPPVLYCKGNGNFQEKRTIAIVGTRDATNYGRGVVEELLSELKNIQIISGLAYGIDITAHKAALKNGLSTIAVLANALDMVYPVSHKKVAEEILENGLLVSEQAINTKLQPQFFISRNRIIAALSEVTLIVESSKKGGSMVTAEFANNYNKDVFAVPGEVNKKQSQGTNTLIFQNKANIFTDPASLVEWMKWNEQKKEVKSLQIDFSSFDEEESRVLSLLQQRGEMLIDDLSWYAQINPNKLSSILLGLEFQDVIKQTPGKKFSIKN